MRKLGTGGLGGASSQTFHICSEMGSDDAKSKPSRDGSTPVRRALKSGWTFIIWRIPFKPHLSRSDMPGIGSCTSGLLLWVGASSFALPAATLLCVGPEDPAAPIAPCGLRLSLAEAGGCPPMRDDCEAALSSLKLPRFWRKSSSPIEPLVSRDGAAATC